MSTGASVGVGGADAPFSVDGTACGRECVAAAEREHGDSDQAEDSGAPHGAGSRGYGASGLDPADLLVVARVYFELVARASAALPSAGGVGAMVQAG